MKFRRVRENRFLFGVFTGLEKFLKAKGMTVSVYILRIIYLALIIVLPDTLMCALILIYLLAAAMIPYEDGSEQ